jgi:hypothetical protein
MSIWTLLQNREDVKALYTDESTTTADKLPLSIRRMLGNFPFEIDYKTYNNPDGHKEFLGLVSKLIGKNLEQKALYVKWLKLPVSEGGKKHSQPSLFRLFESLAHAEEAIHGQVQKDILAEDEQEPATEVEAVVEVPVKRNPMEIIDVPAGVTPVVIEAHPGPLVGTRKVEQESTLDILARINADVLKQSASLNNSQRKITKHVEFMEETVGRRDVPRLSPMADWTTLLNKFSK